MRRTESERVDDIPLIIHWLEQMQIKQIIDQELPPPHGNRLRLSYGQLSVLLLTYIITIDNKPLLHKGHSKDYRPDLLQYRQMLATLDPRLNAFNRCNPGW